MTTGGKKKNSDYDPEQIMNGFLHSVSDLYCSHHSICEIADELDLDCQKVRKLLCMASFRGLCAYESDSAEEILGLYAEKKSVTEIMKFTGRSRASVQSYLPYVKVPYKSSEISFNAARLRVSRERMKTVEMLKMKPDTLWNVITAFQGFPFRTTDGHSFSYTIKGEKMSADRKRKGITKFIVELAYDKARELGGNVSEPEQLGVDGSSYLYPVFVRLGIIKEIL